MDDITRRRVLQTLIALPALSGLVPALRASASEMPHYASLARVAARVRSDVHTQPFNVSGRSL